MAIAATQKWYAGAAAASLVVLAGGWFLLVSPQKASADEIVTQTSSVNSANATTEMQIAALKAEFTQLPQLQSQVALIRQHIPQTPSEPTLLRTITKAAQSSGVVLGSMTLAAPSVIQGGTASGTPAGGNAFAAPGQMSQISMTLNITGNFADTRLFLNSLESMQRVMLVTGINITRGVTPSGATTLTTVVSARVFMANPGTPSVAVTTTSPAVTSATSPS
jgi:Tfp pilus assembly protein PilO